MRHRTGGLVVIGIAAMFLAVPQTSWGFGAFIVGSCVVEDVSGDVLKATAVLHAVSFKEDDTDPKPLRIDLLAELSASVVDSASGVPGEVKTGIFRAHLDYTGTFHEIPLICAALENAGFLTDVRAFFALSGTTELFISGLPDDGVSVSAVQNAISLADSAPVPGSRIFFDKGGTKNDSGYTADAEMGITRFNVVACDPAATPGICPP